MFHPHVECGRNYTLPDTPLTQEYCGHDLKKITHAPKLVRVHTYLVILPRCQERTSIVHPATITLH